MIDLKVCAYKGVEFLFKEASTPLGHRVVAYNYPGSDKQTVEIQGKIPKNFTIEAIIPHDEYYRKRDSLITVLEDKTAGTLQHPTFGRIDNVVSGECQLNETITELGKASITIPFFIDDAQGVPINSATLISQVQAQSDVFTSQIAADIDDGFNVSLSSTGNFDSAFSQFKAIYDKVISAIDSSRKNVSQAARLKQNLDTFIGNARSLIYNPLNELATIAGQVQSLASSFASGSSSTGGASGNTLNNSVVSSTSVAGTNDVLTLSGSIVNIFDGITTLFDDPVDAYEAYTELFDFGDDDIDIPLNTFSRIERNNNRNVIKTAIKSLALSYAYVEAASIEFELTTDLERVQTELEAQYVAIRELQNVTIRQLQEDQNSTIQSGNQTRRASIIESDLISNDALEQLERVRVVALEKIDQGRVATRNIIEIETETIPLSVLVYQYYGNTDLFEAITTLNNIKQNAFVSGKVKMLA